MLFKQAKKAIFVLPFFILGCDALSVNNTQVSISSSKSKEAERFYDLGDKSYDSGDFRKAITQLTKSIELNPKDISSFNLRGLSWYYLGEYKNAIEDYDMAIQINSNIAMCFHNRGMAFEEIYKHNKAIEDFDRAIKLDPTLARAYTSRAVTWIAIDEYEKAIRDLDKSLQLKPNDSTALHNRAVSKYHLGKYKRSIEDYNLSIQFEPNNYRTFYHRGHAWQALNSINETLKDYHQAVKLNPKFAKAHDQIAWILATNAKEQVRDGKLAIEHGKIAVDLTKEMNWNFIDTLAAAYAENGDFDKAVLWQKKAKDMAPDHEKASCDEFLKLYQSNTPYSARFE